MKLKYKRSEDNITNGLVIFLEELGKKVEDKISYLNQGGCCVYASLISQKIRRFFPFIKVYLKVLNSNGSGVNNVLSVKNKLKMKQQNEDNIRNWDKYGIEFKHVMIQLRYRNTNILFDSLGIDKYWDSNRSRFNFMVINKGFLHIKDAIKLSKNPEGWNFQFDREQIPYLRDIVNCEFRDFIKQNVRI